MAKLVDALDLSSNRHYVYEGSSPSEATDSLGLTKILYLILDYIRNIKYLKRIKTHY